MVDTRTHPVPQLTNDRDDITDQMLDYGPGNDEYITDNTNNLEETIKEIQEGKEAEAYPAVASLVNKDSHRPYTNRTGRQYGKAQPQRRLIADVRPPIKERLAIVEYEIDDINIIIAAIQEIVAHTVSKDDIRDDLHELDKRFEGVDKRLDYEIIPQIKALARRRIVKDWLVLFGLTLSSIVNIILLYQKLAEK